MAHPLQPTAAAPAQERRRQQREDARRAILAATEAILVEEGYERFSMRRLAARCGYAAPTIYHYFGDKPGLFDALLETHFSRLVTELEAAGLTDDPVANMHALGVSFARFGLENPDHYRLMMTPRPDAQLLASGEQARSLLEAPIKTLEAQGRLLFDDIESARQVLWGLLHGLISLQQVRPDVDWKPDVVKDALDTWIRGSVRSEEAR